MKGPVHVTLVDQRSLYLVNVVIATDSLFGTGADMAALRHSVPLSEVSRIEENRKSPGRSMLLILVIVIAAVTF
jgi:hypothetical protein